MDNVIKQLLPDGNIPADTVIHSITMGYPKFVNFGWGILYNNYKINVINVLKIYEHISRLYLIKKLDESNNNLDKAMNSISTRRVVKFPISETLSNYLKGILPNADPIYLDIVGEVYSFDENNVSEFIEHITTKSYPTLKEYEELVKKMDIIKSLTVDFSVEQFLRMCPDPTNYFKNIKSNSINTHYEESVSYLSDKFSLYPIKLIRMLFAKENYNLTNTVEALRNYPNPAYLKKKRMSFVEQVDFKLTTNVEFLKEMAYIDHNEEILNHIESKKTVHKVMVEQAKSVGEVYTCQCCYFDGFLVTEVQSCSVGHLLCNLCIKKGVEVAVGENRLNFKCFADCTEELNITMIKKVVDEKLFQRITRLLQIQEIKSANIEGLETCAFCEYSVILTPDIKVINCLNPECQKDTCRKCRFKSHLPDDCNQSESMEVQFRTMIENKMTEVLIRTCYSCQNKFVKEGGCNKMTCSCGKEMCYICRKPLAINEYSHFYHGFLGNIEQSLKCPLFTNEDIVHNAAVEAAARLTKKELSMKRPDMLESIDIDKIIPKLNIKIKQINKMSTMEFNRIVALIIGETPENINNLQDMNESWSGYIKKRPKH